ncbi:hypothetical protein E2C01_019955 [Portunus trituberculatus]|uniref:Uncharacterized protein n=1 Tax=Portunus trituberculatus TaxID=210409 RepID=A0A5B7E007_PORTR|nr:hypothetical protein [Portunus trituberculatus]
MFSAPLPALPDPGPPSITTTTTTTTPSPPPPPHEHPSAASLVKALMFRCWGVSLLHYEQTWYCVGEDQAGWPAAVLRRCVVTCERGGWTGLVIKGEVLL